MRKREVKVKLHKQKKRPDIFLAVLTLGLSLFGLLAIYNASSVLSFRDFSDKYHFVRDQSIWLGLGFLGMVLAAFFDYHRFYKLALPFLLLMFALLIAVFIPGLGIKVLGARRWLDFRFFSFQPAELTKLILVIYLSAWFSLTERGRLWAFLLLSGIVVGLVAIEPDLGTAIIIVSIAFVLYFASGAPFYHFLFLGPLGILGALGFAVISSYRMKRLAIFLNPSLDPLGASYHIRQVLIALGSGGLTGLGLGKSRQKYEYLPEAMTDSIFAITAEELGFIGASILIIVFLLIIYRGIKIALRSPDRFGQLLSLGITSSLAIQVIINLSAMVALLPLTGVPLPFISYGGSSLVVNLIGMGILLNVSKQGMAG